MYETELLQFNRTAPIQSWWRSHTPQGDKTGEGTKPGTPGEPLAPFFAAAGKEKPIRSRKTFDTQTMGREDKGKKRKKAEERAALQALRTKEYAEAMLYCAEHNVGAWACMSQNTDRWTEVKSSTLDDRLKKRVLNGSEWAIRGALTEPEREDIAAAMKAAAEAGHSHSKRDRNQAVVDCLRWRQLTNKLGGRQHVKFSLHAIRILDNNKAGRDFWEKFYLDFPELEVKNQVLY